MSKKMLIDATHAEETRVVVVDGNKVEEFDFESVNKRQLAGNIYLAKVTRVEPSLQAAFVDYGGNRHGFLAFSEIHPDYYQIPVADREALLEEERAYAKALAEEDEKKPKSRSRRRSRGKGSKAAANKDASVSEAVETGDIKGMDVVDVAESDEAHEPIIGFSEAAEEGTEEKARDSGSDTPAADVNEADSPAEEAESAEDDTQIKEWAEDQQAEAEEAEASRDEEADSDEAEEPEENTDIESVAQEDEQEEIHPKRKPRPRRYKIQEVIKVRQILLIQVVKEERGNKGAALTTYLSLAGRYCVLMPNTARGGGISRKITNAADRKKLKDIAGGIEVPEGAGLIIRTAGAKRTKSEIKRDYDYLLRQWEQVRDLTLKSIAPAPIYEEGSLIKRSIRDLYNREIEEVLIEGETGYRMAKDYMKMLMPSHAKNVKLYTDPLPLFARFQVESYLGGMFNPTVQLKSGGYIVIGVTEALVAIDVNSGRATKEASIEDTALKTNLEAAEEVARQLRLRDLAGLIVIDFIDMEDRRNNSAVEKRIKERLKTDRARIQVGRISGFGLMEMSRQRLRPGMIEATTAPCPHCHGTGLTRSDDNLSLSILRELEEEGVRRRSREVLVTAPIAIANYILNQKREHVAMIESRYGISIRVDSSPTLISPEYTIERFKTATRNVPEPSVDVVSMESSLIETPVEDETQPEPDDDTTPRKKRRRRRRRGGRGKSNGAQAEAASAEAVAPESEAQPVAEAEPVEPSDQPEDTVPEKAKAKKRTTKRAAAKADSEAAEAPVDTAIETPSEPAPEAADEEAPAKPKPRTRRRSKKAEVEADVAGEEAAVSEPMAEVKEGVASAPKRKPGRKPKAKPAPEPEPALVGAEAEAPAVTTPEDEPAPAPEPAPVKPKRRGWWSR